MKKLLLILILPVMVWAGLLNGLKSYYKFDSSGVDIVSGLNLSSSGFISYKVGICDSAINFLAVGYMETVDTNFFDMDSFSISYWVTNSSWQTGSFERTMWRGDLSEDGSQSTFHFNYRNDSDKFYFWIGSGSTNIGCTYEVTPVDDRFYHVVGTYDGSKMILYWDGDPVDTVETTITPYANGKKLLIGVGEYTRYWTGRIDELGIWDRALDATEVDSLYNFGGSLSYPFDKPEPRLNTLIHSYPFDVSAVDCVGVLDGTLNNSPQLVSGKNGSAYNFDSSSTITFSNNLDIDGYGQTISMWVKRDSLTHGGPGISGDQFSDYNGLQFFILSNDSITMRYGDGSSNGPEERKSFSVSATITDTLWHHVAINCVNFDTIEIFLDGTKYIAEYSSGGAAFTDWINAIYKLSDESTSYTGTIDQLDIFQNRLDSATIVDSLYNSGDGWFPFAIATTDSFTIRQSGISLDSLSSISGVSIPAVRQRSGGSVRE